MDMLSIKRLRAGMEKEEISESKKSIDPMDISASKIGTDIDMLSVKRLRTSSESKRGIDPKDISASKIGADMDMRSIRRLRAGSESKRDIDPMDISASKIGADMDMLSIRRRAWSLRALPFGSATAAGMDKDISASKIGVDMDMLSVKRLRTGSEPRRGIEPMDISASKIGADMDMLSHRRRALRLWRPMMSLGVRCLITAPPRSLPP